MNVEVRKKETKIKHFANKGQVMMAFVMVLIGVILERCLNKPPTFKSPNLKYVSQDPEL